jgi:hypothetical protein
MTPRTAPRFSSDDVQVSWKVPKGLMKHGKMWLDLCWLNLGMLTSLALAWNGIMLMDSSDNVALCWLPGSGIIWNKSWLCKSHMAHAECVACLDVCWWGIALFIHSITQDTTICSWSCRTTIIMTLCTLSVSTQSPTSSGNTLSAMPIVLCSLMNCISCTWD